jgi:mono/diheme cytochrome c family protein
MKWAWASLMPLLLVGCGRPDPSQRFVPPQDVQDFAQLFEQNCRGCHGPDGSHGPAPPLNDPLFLAIVPDAELKQVITAGRKGALMPPFAVEHGGKLTPEQIDILVSEMRKRWEKKDDTDRRHLPAYAVGAGAAKGDPKRGAKVFAMACASCHGDDGNGGDVGPVNDPNFLALISDQELRRIVITGRSDFGMPDYTSAEGRDPGFTPLSDRDIADVVALLMSWKRAAKTKE